MDELSVHVVIDREVNGSNPGVVNFFSTRLSCESSSSDICRFMFLFQCRFASTAAVFRHFAGCVRIYSSIHMCQQFSSSGGRNFITKSQMYNASKLLYLYFIIGYYSCESISFAVLCCGAPEFFVV